MWRGRLVTKLSPAKIEQTKLVESIEQDLFVTTQLLVKYLYRYQGIYNEWVLVKNRLIRASLQKRLSDAEWNR